MSKPSVIFFGNERLATGVSTKCPTLTKLIKSGFEVKAVISHHQVGLSRSKRQLEISEIADSNSIPHLFPASSKEILEIVKSHKADIGVLVAFGKIVPQTVIDALPMGIINLHPSLLPKHRGPTPIESCIIGGEDKTGVTIIKLASKMDAGPIYSQQVIAVPKLISKQDLADKLGDVGSEQIIETLENLKSAEQTLNPQNEDEATYDKLISKSDGELQFTEAADTLERKIRAYEGWPGTRFSIGDLQLSIIKACTGEDFSSKIGSISVSPDRELLIQTGSGSLVIKSLQPAGKKPMTSSAFISGYGQKLELTTLP